MEQPTYSHKDCKAIPPSDRFHLRSVRLHAALALALGAAGVLLFAVSQRAEAIRHQETSHLTVPVALPETPPVASSPISTLSEQMVTVRSGDSLAGIFYRVGLSPDVMYEVLGSSGDARELKALKPGETLRFQMENGTLHRLDYAMDRTRTLEVTARNGAFESALVVQTPEVRVAHTQAVIDSSLYSAGIKAGLSDNLIMQMANVFGWDIDFALDIRNGDRFAVLYEERYVQGEKLEDGDILAAVFENNGRVFKAVKYTDPSGHTDYYDTEGRSMRKAFLRSPVDFRRISSRFQPERFHPVLGVKRPHKGVDYAAAVGTPIKAAGDGKIVFTGYKGGYGNTVIIQHGGQYSTLYGHLSRYQKGVGTGSRVRQGQTIGYVGKSGLATGPHLHYEFRVSGVHRNPLTVKLPNAAPISAAVRNDFQQHATELLARIELFDKVQVAASEQAVSGQ